MRFLASSLNRERTLMINSGGNHWTYQGGDRFEPDRGLNLQHMQRQPSWEKSSVTSATKAQFSTCSSSFAGARGQRLIRSLMI